MHFCQNVFFEYVWLFLVSASIAFKGLIYATFLYDANLYEIILFDLFTKD